MNLTIKLVRHGESEANVGLADPRVVGDHLIHLTARGCAQARAAGATLGAAFLDDALVYCSPYRRAKQTLACLLAGADVTAERVRVYEDPRLREVDHGYADIDAQQAMRKVHGWFYYRYQGGESPADAFDRTSGFLEGLMRQTYRKQCQRILIVTHGLTIRCFVTRFLHLTVADFDRIANPANGGIVTLGCKDEMTDPVFTSNWWGVEGLRLLPAEPCDLWEGRPPPVP